MAVFFPLEVDRLLAVDATVFFAGAFFAVATGASFLPPDATFESADLRCPALLSWMRFAFAALSIALKAAESASFDGEAVAFLTSSL